MAETVIGGRNSFKKINNIAEVLEILDIFQKLLKI
jgi:hypothetical protein